MRRHVPKTIVLLGQGDVLFALWDIAVIFCLIYPVLKANSSWSVDSWTSFCS